MQLISAFLILYPSLSIFFSVSSVWFWFWFSSFSLSIGFHDGFLSVSFWIYPFYQAYIIRARTIRILVVYMHPTATISFFVVNLILCSFSFLFFSAFIDSPVYLYFWIVAVVVGNPFTRPLFP